MAFGIRSAVGESWARRLDSEGRVEQQSTPQVVVGVQKGRFKSGRKREWEAENDQRRRGDKSSAKALLDGQRRKMYEGKHRLKHKTEQYGMVHLHSLSVQRSSQAPTPRLSCPALHHPHSSPSSSSPLPNHPQPLLPSIRLTQPDSCQTGRKFHS